MQSILFSLAIFSASVAGVTASPTTSARSLSIFKDNFSRGGVAPRTKDGQDVWLIPKSCTPQCQVFFDFVDKCEGNKNPTLDDILKCECKDEFSAGLASCVTCYIDSVCSGDCEDCKTGDEAKKGEGKHWQGRNNDKTGPQCVKDLTTVGQVLFDKFSKDCANVNYSVETLNLGTWEATTR